MENYTHKTHQAMHKEMLTDMRREDMQNQFDAILTGHEALIEDSITKLSKIPESWGRMNKASSQ